MKSLIVANWKMHPATYAEAKKLFDATKKAIESYQQLSLVIAPPALFLRELSKGYRGKISFATQGAQAEDSGAQTGEHSLAQMKHVRCSHAIVGHAERRARGETDAQIAAQVTHALELGMTPILCVGEHTRTADGAHFAFVREQLRLALVNIKAPHVKKIIIAYEPVWAIGAPAPMSPHDMHEMSIFIRKSVVAQHGPAAMDIRILYGGAVDETNAEAMMRNGDVYGFLVGRASVDAIRFAKLIHTLGDI
jgi:triosephosphate isomerase